MVTWVLAEEPTEQVQRVIAAVETRIGSDSEVMWVCPGPIVESIGE